MENPCDEGALGVEMLECCDLYTSEAVANAMPAVVCDALRDYVYQNVVTSQYWQPLARRCIAGRKFAARRRMH
jgi:hypothetical protein